MSRATGKVETPEYAKMVGRMIRAYARRVGNADPEDLAVMVAVSDELDKAITQAVYLQRTQYGRTWQEIASALGITRSAAFQRWAGRVASLEADTRREVEYEAAAGHG